MKKVVPLLTIFHKQNIVILLFLLSLSSTIAQVKIGDNPQNIDAASLLELESTDKAMVLSRITTAQMQVITPLQGAVIYNIEEQCVFYYNGSNWINLCKDANGFSIVDNGNNTYTVNDGTNPEFIFSTNTETVTDIVQNTDGTFTYTNEANEEFVIANGSGTGMSSLSIVNNGDNTYTVDDGVNPTFDIEGKPETVTSLVDNTDGTYTYTNEANVETTISSNELTIVDNGDNTYTVDDGVNPTFDIEGKPETVTSLVDNIDGTYTYTNEANIETTISSNEFTIVDNGDNTYTVTDGDNPPFDIEGKPETVTSFTENGNGTYTYTNEANDVTEISLTTGATEEGSVFFADDANGIAENNAQLFWDNTNEYLGVGTNTNLTDKLTINGTLGISDGSEAEPSYRFSADSNTGMFRAADNELGFTAGGTSKMKLTEGGLFLNNPLPLDPALKDKPLLVRANEGDLFGLQRSDGELKWLLNLFEKNPTFSIQGGLSFVEAGVDIKSRLFIENARNIGGLDIGRIGINTQSPQAALDVVGTIRVSDLPPTQANENFVTVDGQGNFHQSVSAQPVVTGGGRWNNSTTPIPLSGSGLAVLPIFDIIDYNDGGGEFYEPNSNELLIKKDGRYEIAATIALTGNVKTAGGQAVNTYARIAVNGLDVGAISVAGSSGSIDVNAFSSIHISDLLNLQANDIVTIKLFSNASPATLKFVGPATSSITINKQ